MLALNVAKDFLTLLIWQYIGEFTQERSPTDVDYVVKVLFPVII